jgi:hypothetical protein
METVEVERLNGEPIIIARFGADYDMASGFSESRMVVEKAFGARPEPVYYILNLSALKFSFSELVMRLADLTNEKTGPYRSPFLKEIIFVTESDLGKVAADALQQEQYGARKSKFFSSEEDAIKYVRSQVGN